MNALDFSPLFRSTVGFDHLSRLLESSLTSDNTVAYPPYNIEKLDEDNYRITMAVAGFTDRDIEMTAQDNQLIVQGRIAKNEEDKGRVYLHRGIAERSFERRFQLADHIRVTDASLENGLLNIMLVREIPEAKKLRRIEIASGKTIEQKKN